VTWQLVTAIHDKHDGLLLFRETCMVITILILVMLVLVLLELIEWLPSRCCGVEPAMPFVCIRCDRRN
jgi:hypothetical protein